MERNWYTSEIGNVKPLVRNLKAFIPQVIWTTGWPQVHVFRISCRTRQGHDFQTIWFSEKGHLNHCNTCLMQFSRIHEEESKRPQIFAAENHTRLRNHCGIHMYSPFIKVTLRTPLYQAILYFPSREKCLFVVKVNFFKISTKEYRKWCVIFKATLTFAAT